MLNFTEKIIDRFSNKVSALSFTGGSHLHLPILNAEGSSQSSYYPKSLFLASTELSYASNILTESRINENLAKSRISKEAIELKRSIIKKMNEKILLLEKKSKNQKMDILELQACKNDLLLDFLEYEKSKRKHREELAQREENFEQEQKEFYFMKSELPEPNQESKAAKGINFRKNAGRSRSPVEQQITELKVTPIQIMVPMIKIIEIEIPMLNLGENKIRQTGTTQPTRNDNQREGCFAGISQQVNSVYHLEIQQNDCSQYLPLDSSRSGISLNEARVLDLCTERSEKSIDYRQSRRSDRFYFEEEDLIKNLKQKDEICYNQKTQRSNYQCYRDSEENTNKSFDKEKNKSFNCSFKQSILHDELKLNSEISQKQSSEYQQKRISIQNQTTEFYKNKIAQLYSDLRQKAQMIGNLLRQNEIFVKEIEQMDSKDEKKQRAIQAANMKIQKLQEKVEELQKQARQVEQRGQETSNKMMNEIYQLEGEVQAKNEEMGLMMDSMEIVEQNAYNKEKDLLKEIQALENTIQKIKDEIDFYKKRIESEGIQLDVADLQIIEEAIDQRQKAHESNIERLKSIYESKISQFKEMCSTLEVQTKELQQKNHHLSLESETKSKLIQNNSTIAVKEEQITQIMDLYDTELQQRDHQIIQLKRQLAQSHMALMEAVHIIYETQPQNASVSIQCQTQESDYFKSPHDEMVIKILTEKNQCLEERLAQELINRKQMTKKLLKLQQLILSDYEPSKSLGQTQKTDLIDEDSHEYGLIQALSEELESLMKQLKKQKQNKKKLKQKLSEERPCSPTSQSKYIRDLRQKVSKLSRYSGLLEKQIKEIYKVDECQAHQKIIHRLQEQLKNGHTDSSNEKIQSIMRVTQ